MSTISTGDLRKNARDHGRDKAHKAKWAHGARPYSGSTCQHNVFYPRGCTECDQRPWPRNMSRNYTSWKQRVYGKESTKDNNVTRKAFRNTVVEGLDDARDDLSDSSANAEVEDTSAAPDLNEVMYSFDAATGPNRGGNVLSFAITQAVQRFENNETEKIVKNEYDLVLDAEDGPLSTVADADDDFELIDDSHLK